MDQTIIINDMEINAFNVQVGSTRKNGVTRITLSFDFEVTHAAYHDVTTLLYKNDFRVKVPEKNLEFPAAISSYSTSVVNLYEPGAVGNFNLELTEKE
ncbi:hypothetical protein GCM10007063_09070 [Lentibacillus kapialis]|uniref:DUF3219 family protein n=1 Tax=Lentibacillus kapialis TaxID=340214 RepID=A0A917PQY5_9BACI|nr:DUF3219 family protein [Lentibacillus kapialis]GGJ88744.1 hypothetical protein GCM10007063_09070 [Lentibacillus kapialis]